MPPTLVAGLYGMNVHLPGVGSPDTRAVLVIAGGIAAVTVGMLWMFRRKRWL